MQSAVIFDDTVNQCLCCNNVIHIQIRTSTTRKSGQGLGDFGRTLVAGGSSNNHQALVGQLQRNCSAYAARCPCDQGYLAFKL